MFYGTNNIWLVVRYFLTFIFLPRRSFHFSAIEPSTKSNLHNRDNQLLHQEPAQPNTHKTEIPVPAESLALPEYHKGEVQPPTPSFPSFWLCSAVWQGNGDNKGAARIKKEREETGVTWSAPRPRSPWWCTPHWHWVVGIGSQNSCEGLQCPLECSPGKISGSPLLPRLRWHRGIWSSPPSL